jgi:hypothetical protein
MLAKHLEGLINHLLLLAGLPSPLPRHPHGDDARQDPALPEPRSLQVVPVKNFLHYL